MSDEKTIFQASLRRCLARPEFLERFYEIFLASSPAVKAKFAETDFERQKRVLRQSFMVIEVCAESPPGSPAWSALEDVAVAHDRHHRDIPPEMYDQWLESLVQTVRDVDPEVTDEVETAWRQMLASAIAYMRAAYPGRS